VKKASIQISVNFLVVIIISIIIMSFGFILVNKMILQSDDISKGVSERLIEQTEKLLLRDGDLVAIPLIQKTIDRDDVDMFAVGVLNTVGTEDFYVNVVYNMYVDEDKTVSEGNQPFVSVINGFDVGKPIEILNNEVYVFSIPIKVKNTAPKGEYTFNVYVSTQNDCENSDCCYDESIHKIYVKVP